MGGVRPAAVAGTWYSAEPARLARELDGYLARVTTSVPPPRAVIAPHAGLTYSGPVAAYAYGAVRSSRVRAVVLVGPSHFVSFNGVSIWPAGAWETPLGRLNVDETLARALMAASDAIVDVEVAHRREHSLEMQLPFLAYLLPAVPIVPIVMGHQTRATVFALADALTTVLATRGSDVLLVASSDLSHYEEADLAAQLDGAVLRHVESLDCEGLMRTLEIEPRHACGGGPMVSVMAAVKRLGVSRAEVLRYADSGDVSGDKSSVVGYMAAAMW